MAKEIEFKAISTELKIGGESYSFTVSTDTPMVCGEILTEARRRLRLIKAGKREKEIEENEICKFFKDSIERLLGEGTVERIFESKQKGIEELAEVLCLIAAEIRKVFSEYDRQLSQENK